MENAQKAHVDGRSSSVVTRILAASADLALYVDVDGVIREVSVGDSLPKSPAWKTLVGKVCANTVTNDSKAKVDLLLSEARRSQRAKSRELNLRIEGIPEAPFRFGAVLDDDQRVLMIGRDLRPIADMQQKLVASQQAMDLEYARLRQADTRYRVLFQVASEGVLVADASTKRVVEANPAAATMLGASEKSLQGKAITDFFAGPSRRIVDSLMAAVEGGARAVDTVVNLEGTPARPVTVSATAFRQTGSTLIMLRFWSAEVVSAASTVRSSRLLSVVDALPDGFVVTGDDGRILSANPAFCEVAQQANESQVVGERLDRWVGRPGVDVQIMLANLREHGVVRGFSTIVRGDFGPPTEAQVTAVSALDAKYPCLGFTIRPVSSVLAASRGSSPVSAVMPRSVDQLRELVGRVSLKELVRESSELIERLCIEAALSVSGNNRASAAQLLGLSRQGLYLKLKRHGIEGSDEEA